MTKIEDELEQFFFDEKMTLDEQAKFYLTPDDKRYYTWQFIRFKKLYLEKDYRGIK
jgi:hypothetical protein